MPRLALITTFVLAFAPCAVAQDGDELALRVVDVEGRALAGAELRFRVFGEHEDFRDTPHEVLDVDRRLRNGASVLSARDGTARHAWPCDRAVLVSGRLGDLWGYRWLPRSWRETEAERRAAGKPVDLVLVPDWTLRARVEDVAGWPVRGVCVRLFGPDLSIEKASDSDGMVAFEHVGFLARRLRTPLGVEADVLAFPQPVIALPREAGPRDVLSLRLPPTASVEVHVFSADGRPVRDGTHVDLIREWTELEPDQRFDTRERACVTAFTRDGAVRFEHVGLGMSLVARSIRARARFSGPEWAGSTITATLTLDPMPFVPPAAASGGAAGAREAESASFSTRLLVDPGISPGALKISVHGKSALGHRVSIGLGAWSDGTISCRELPVGNLRLSVLWPGAPTWSDSVQPLLDVPLLLEEENKRFVARGEVLDVRGKLFRHEIVVSGADPLRRFHARVYFRRAGDTDPRQFSSVLAHGLEVELVSPWPCVDVDLLAPGYRAVELREVCGEADVELSPGVPVRLRLRSDVELPKPPRYLTAALVPWGRPGEIDRYGPRFGPSREIVTTAFAPGPTRVVWYGIEEKPDGTHRGGSLCRAEPQLVRVADVDVEQVLEVTLTAAQLARLFGE